MKHLLAAVTLLAGLMGLVALASPPPAAQAATLTVGQRILAQAQTRAGDAYDYGATGPTAFDCSGLVYWAAGRAGLRNWPRDTFDIAAEIGTRFEIVTHPQAGDLALWGPVSAPYHVEIVTSPNHSFGAQTYGIPVGGHADTYFEPSFYLRALY